mgnify:CR=1 FL=1
MLIDFGGMKAAAMQIRNQLSIGGSGTTEIQTGKLGYIPPEQSASGQVDMTSDLYALAATLLVLGTGKDPQDLHNPATGSWTGFDAFSPKLGSVLTKMLEVYPTDRYQTADTVLAALNSGRSNSQTTRQISRNQTSSQISNQTSQNQPTIALNGSEPLDESSAADQPTENTAFVSSMFSVDSFPEAAAADNIPVDGNAIYPPVDMPSPIDTSSINTLTDTTDEILADNTVAIPAEISVEGFTDDVIDQSIDHDINQRTAIYDAEDYEGYADGAATSMMAAGMSGTADNKSVSSTYETTLAESQVHEPEMADEIVERRDSRQAILPLLILLGVFASFLGLAWMNSFFNARRSLAGADNRPRADNVVEWEGPYSREETARRAEILTRRESLGLGENTFTRLVDQVFYEEYPMLRTSGTGGGRKALTSAPEDEPLRLRWDNIALNLLETFEGNLSRRSLALLGEYSESDRTRWQSQVNQVNVSAKALYDLVDAKFSTVFPNQGGQDFLSLPVGQLYYAIAEDKAQAIAEGAARESVSFAPGTFRTDIINRIGPGNGRVYTLQLTAGQLLRLSLNAEPNDGTLLSIYVPNPTDETPAIIEDSEQTTWSGEVAQSGIYEITVVNQSDVAIDYELAIAADNVSTTAPSAPPSPAENDQTEDRQPENESTEETDNSSEENPTEDLPPIGENNEQD